MSLASKILVGFIIFGAIVVVFLSARVVRIQSTHRTKAQRLEQDLRTTTEANALLRDRPTWSESGEPAIRELKAKLARQVSDRGRAWFGAKFLGFSPTSSLGVELTGEPPPSLAPQTVLYAFRASVEGGPATYVGEFKVASVNMEKSRTVLDLQPAREVIPAILERVQQLQPNSTLLTIYSQMPGDRHEAFAGMSDEELAKLLPASVVAEYRKHGQEAAADDPAERKVEGRYIRKLRSYEVALPRAYEDLASLGSAIDGAKVDVQALQSSLELAKQQIVIEDAEIVAQRQELARSKSEQETARRVEQQVEAELTRVRGEVDQLLAQNRQQAARWTAEQFRLLETTDPAARP
jgi:hypothetical protein